MFVCLSPIFGIFLHREKDGNTLPPPKQDGFEINIEVSKLTITFLEITIEGIVSRSPKSERFFDMISVFGSCTGRSRKNVAVFF